MNIYEQFLDYLKTKQYPVGTKLEWHHEPPRFSKKAHYDSPDNVYASFRDHALLHYYRFLAYGEIQDYIAWMYRLDHSIAARKAGQLGGHQSFKKKVGWFAHDPVVKGRRGGLKTSQYQNEHRQSSEFKKLVRQSYEWSYQGQPVLCTFNCTNGRQIFDELIKYPGYQLPACKRYVSAVNRSIKTGIAMWGMKPTVIDKAISSQVSSKELVGSETTGFEVTIVIPESTSRPIQGDDIVHALVKT